MAPKSYILIYIITCVFGGWSWFERANVFVSCDRRKKEEAERIKAIRAEQRLAAEREEEEEEEEEEDSKPRRKKSKKVMEEEEVSESWVPSDCTDSVHSLSGVVLHCMLFILSVLLVNKCVTVKL